jgi:hypothetical protein
MISKPKFSGNIFLVFSLILVLTHAFRKNGTPIGEGDTHPPPSLLLNPDSVNLLKFIVFESRMYQILLDTNATKYSKTIYIYI